MAHGTRNVAARLAQFGESEMVAHNTRGDYNTITAAGTTQATAVECNADTVMVTAGTASSGVLLRPMNVKEEQIVCNGTDGNASTGIDLFVYPRTGGKINNMTANTPLLLPAGMAARFRAIDGAGNVIA